MNRLPRRGVKPEPPTEKPTIAPPRPPYPGLSYSISQNACMIKFTGGGPYDGQEGFYDSDHAGLTICVNRDGVQYDYTRAGPKHFRLSTVWIDGKKAEI